MLTKDLARFKTCLYIYIKNSFTVSMTIETQIDTDLDIRCQSTVMGPGE